MLFKDRAQRLIHFAPHHIASIEACGAVVLSALEYLDDDRVHFKTPARQILLRKAREQTFPLRHPGVQRPPVPAQIDLMNRATKLFKISTRPQVFRCTCGIDLESNRGSSKTRSSSPGCLPAAGDDHPLAQRANVSEVGPRHNVLHERGVRRRCALSVRNAGKFERMIEIERISAEWWLVANHAAGGGWDAY